MAFDGGFLYKLVAELKGAIDCHIDKIYQPSKDELVFLLRKKGFVKRLLITVKSGGVRIHFTENKFENPAVPPNFCMLLRKHLSSARLIEVVQNGFERVVELMFSATNEMGDTVNLKLVCELIGNQANVILVRDDGKIIDALRHSDVETAKRLILPGGVYEYPESLKKKNPQTAVTRCEFEEIVSDNREISKVLLSRFDGFSPLICREIEFLTHEYSNPDTTDSAALETAFNKIVGALSGESLPTIIYDENKNPFEFSYTEINQYPQYERKHFESLSLLLDAFYSEKDNATRISAAAHGIFKTVTNLKTRTQRKLALRLEELKSCENRDSLRIYGELLKANLYCIENGSSFAEVQNYYDENLALVRIPLDVTLSPAKNAEKYFKEYKKTYTAEQTLTKLTLQDREELIYFDSVLDSISRCATLSELDEIKQELIEAGYVKSSRVTKKAKSSKISLKEYQSEEGWRILVGKNNLQNDYLTTRLASKGDLWFHVKNIPGSHVVVFCGGAEVSDQTILEAATLAAKNSKAADSSQVPVDYTPIKNVKKPSGAKPGMVIYTTNKTVYINPNKPFEK